MNDIYSKHINKLRSPNFITYVIINGKYYQNLSDKHEDGIVFERNTLKVLSHVKVKKPIHLLFLASKDCRNDLNLIASKGSSFQLIEEHISLTDCYYTNNININIIAQDNSKIIYYKLQNKKIEDRVVPNLLSFKINYESYSLISN